MKKQKDYTIFTILFALAFTILLHAGCHYSLTNKYDMPEEIEAIQKGDKLICDSVKNGIVYFSYSK